MAEARKKKRWLLSLMASLALAATFWVVASEREFALLYQLEPRQVRQKNLDGVLSAVERGPVRQITFVYPAAKSSEVLAALKRKFVGAWTHHESASEENADINSDGYEVLYARALDDRNRRAGGEVPLRKGECEVKIYRDLTTIEQIKRIFDHE